MEKLKSIDYSNIVDMDLAELTQAEILCSGVESPSPEVLYLQILKLYLTNDMNGLRKLLDRYGGSSISDEVNLVIKLGKARLALREYRLTESDREDLRSLRPSNSVLAAEIQFLLGLSYFESQFVLAKKHFQTAAELYEKVNAFKKATRSLLNVVVAESRQFPDKKVVADYFYVANLAKERNVPGVAGICYMNISREYQKLGALHAALDNIDKALHELQKEYPANHYGQAMLYRAHILMDLGRPLDAKLDLEKVRILDFPEIQQAIQVMEAQIKSGNQTEVTQESSHLTPTWQERLQEFSAGKDALSLTSKEEGLIEVLSLGPKTKFEIIEKLYPEESSTEFEVLEDRFKQVMRRIRKKLPDMIHLRNGSYELSDQFFLSGTFKKVEP